MVVILILMRVYVNQILIYLFTLIIKQSNVGAVAKLGEGARGT